jgi:hypothetical protein
MQLQNSGCEYEQVGDLGVPDSPINTQMESEKFAHC